jgi:hypothetical protein
MSSLYRQYFTPEEIYLLDHTDRNDLTSEINLLRILLARLLEAWQKARDLALKQQAAIVTTIARTGQTIARLAKLQAHLHHPLEDLWRAIEQGEHLARQRHHVYDHLSPQPAA